MFESVLNRKANLEQLSVQPGDVPITYADIGKAKKLLGYEPKVNIKEGLVNFINWYKGKRLH